MAKKVKYDLKDGQYSKNSSTTYEGVRYLTDDDGYKSGIDFEYYKAMPGFDAFMKDSKINNFNSENDVKNFNDFVAKGTGSSSSSSDSKNNDLKINGSNSGGWDGKTMKIDPDSATFTGFDKIVSGGKLDNPGTKLSKKEKYNDLIEQIKGKHYDEDGNLVIPKFGKPDRIKRTKKQKKANKELDSKFGKKGYYKTDEIKAPTLSDFGIRNKYEKAGTALADRLGIDKDRPSDGPAILRQQKKRYDKSGALKIPDYSLDKLGEKYMKIGKENTSTAGVKR